MVPVVPSASPKVVDGKRVLGVVPGKPIAGERKVIDRDDSATVRPHLWARHAVAAMVTLLIVMVIAVFADAPPREVVVPYR